MTRPARLAAAAFAALALFGPRPAPAAEISIACGAVGIEAQLCREGAQDWARQSGGHQVRLVHTPAATNERLALFQQLLAAESASVDVFQIDVIWPGTLGRDFVDLREHVPADEIAAHFPSMLVNNTVDGELKALPWFADGGLLYYRKDLLDELGLGPPKTWAELEATAERVLAAQSTRGNHRLKGFVFQGKAYEGLTCNALEWIHSFGGGAILTEDGAVDVDNPRAIAAVEMVSGWIGEIVPEAVLAYGEEEARGAFQSGNAVFMRNWPYAWALLDASDSPVRGRVGVAPLPAGPDGVSTSTLGGGGLAVSRFSTHPKIAAELVRFLAGAAEQKRRAVLGGFNPSIAALYEDPDVLEAQPFLLTLYPALAAAVPRPARIAGVDYNRLSTMVWNAVHDALSGRAVAADSLGVAQRRIERISRDGTWPQR